MIRLQFSLQDAVSSRMIAWFSAGHFSHVDAVYGNNLYGARSDVTWAGYSDKTVPAGVQMRPWHYAAFVKRVIIGVPATEVQVNNFWFFLRQQEGKPYDRTAILGFMAGRDWREDDSWFCSELQAAALEYAGVFGKLYLAANKITPVALAFAVTAIDGHVVEEYVR